MSDAEGFAAPIPAGRNDEQSPFDVEAAAEAIERLDAARTAPRRRDGAAGAADEEAPLGDDAAAEESGAGPALSPAEAALLLEQQLRAFDGVNWARMAAEDPDLHAQARPVFEALRAALAAAEGPQGDGSVAAPAGALAHGQTLAAERDALAAKEPAFADPQRAPREAAALIGYLAKAGYSAQDIDTLSDHRHVLLARKAMLYDRLVEGRARVAETVKALPRVQAPGAAPERREPAVARRGALMQRLRRSGRVEDAARLIEELI
jgi:hypothetical protein